MDGNSPDLNEMFARLVIMGEKTSTHDFSSDVGNTSRGDDLLGSLSVSLIRIGKHLRLTNSKRTSSDAILPILPIRHSENDKSYV